MTTTRAAAEPAAEPAISGLPQLLRMVGVVAAPTTLLTSLLFYFGWSHAYWFFDFLPAAWSPADGVAILMPKSDALRLELVPASAREGARPVTC